MAPPKQSICWQLITLQPDLKTAVCNICQIQLVYQKRGNTNLLRHLRTKHPVELARCEIKSQSTDTGRPSIQLPASCLHVSTHTNPPVSLKVVANAPSTASSFSNSSEHSSRELITQSTNKVVPQYKAGTSRKRELDACVLNLVTSDLLPLSVVENKAFTRLIKHLDSRYEVMSKETLTFHLLPTKYQEEKARLKFMIEEVKHVSITTDFWTSREIECFVTVTAHFITEDWQLQSRVLNTVPLQSSDTAEKLSTTLQEVFAEWGISNKVRTCVTDGAEKIVSAVQKLNLRHQPCFAHTLNLVVKDSIKETYDLFTAITRLKTIVHFFKHSTIGTYHLKDVHKNSKTMFRKLKQEVEKRWNSTYEMIESYIEQHDQVTMALYLSGEEQMCLTTEELGVLRNAMTILEPFYEATVELSSERHTTVAKIIPLVNILRRMVWRDISPLSARLHQQLQNHFRIIDTEPHLHEHLMMATLLDPRYMRNGFPTTDFLDSAIKKLKEVAGSLPQWSETQENGLKEPTATPAKKPSLLWASFEEQVQKKQQMTARMTAMQVAELELRRHLEKPSISRDASSLDYWRDHCASFPRLSEIVKDVLSIPATSVPSERLFSKTGESISDRRSAFDEDDVDMILFLNSIQEL